MDDDNAHVGQGLSEFTDMSGSISPPFTQVGGLGPISGETVEATTLGYIGSYAYPETPSVKAQLAFEVLKFTKGLVNCGAQAKFAPVEDAAIEALVRYFGE